MLFVTLETRRKMGRVSFRKGVWDRYWERPSAIGQFVFHCPSYSPRSLCKSWLGPVCFSFLEWRIVNCIYYASKVYRLCLNPGTYHTWSKHDLFSYSRTNVQRLEEANNNNNNNLIRHYLQILSFDLKRDNDLLFLLFYLRNCAFFILDV